MVELSLKLIIMTQKNALSILKSGANVFLTGEPGSGKTHVVIEYVSWLRDRGIEPAITASTGIAATHIGGFTVHSWSGIGIKEKLTAHDLKHISGNKRVARRILEAHILIIDEISMLSAGTLTMVEQVCRTIRGGEKSFGGLQVVLVGDFFQLPPIVKKPIFEDVQEELFVSDDNSSGFAFDSEVWQKLNPKVCYLSEQHRQDDGDFLDILSAIRSSSVEEKHIALLKTRVSSVYSEESTKLYSHNMNVDSINDRELAKLSGENHLFTMTDSGPKELVTILKRGCLSPEVLALRLGAKVMFTRNDQSYRFVNGTLGVVVGFSKDNDFPMIKISGGRTITAELGEWSIEDGGRILAQVKQIPLRLAWAITIHKSQGMSLDSACMDLSRTFEYGQGYVALSRVRTFSGLILFGMNERALQVHPEVSAKDVEFREMSLIEEEKIQNISAEEQSKKEKEFIIYCGGRVGGRKKPEDDYVLIHDNFFDEKIKTDDHDGPIRTNERMARGGEKAYSVENFRKKYPNAYKGWTAEEDKDLIRRYMTGERVEDLMEAFGRQRGSIRARIVKLGLVEE